MAAVVWSQFLTFSVVDRNSDITFAGASKRTQININFDDAYNGVEKTIKLNVISSYDNDQNPTRQTKTVKVTIPAGVEDGMRLKLSGYGDAGIGGGPNGDLYVDISVKEHGVFKRIDENIILELQFHFMKQPLVVNEKYQQWMVSIRSIFRLGSSLKKSSQYQEKVSPQSMVWEEAIC